MNKDEKEEIRANIYTIVLHRGFMLIKNRPLIAEENVVFIYILNCKLALFDYRVNLTNVKLMKTLIKKKKLASRITFDYMSFVDFLIFKYTLFFIILTLKH